MALNSHYRKQLVFSYENLDQSERAYNKLLNKIANLDDSGSVDKIMFDKYNNMFKEYISNDLNTANAITLIYDLLKDNDVNDKTKLELISAFDKVLSLNLINVDDVSDNHEYILKQIELRNEAKKNKNFELADKIRDDLKKDGIILVDTRSGTTYKLEV